LDIPLIQLLDASFIERYEADEHPIGRPVGDSSARYGANLLPIDYRARSSTSPIFNYPYERTREALHDLGRAGDCDRCHGFKMRYTNPTNGDHAMPTMGTFILLRFHRRSPPQHGRLGVRRRRRPGPNALATRCSSGDPRISSSSELELTAHEALEDDCVLFRLSDRAVQKDRRMARGPRQRLTP
jgi:gentisate 1,2-dioxygenase